MSSLKTERTGFSLKQTLGTTRRRNLAYGRGTKRNMLFMGPGKL
jgi:hypothetical protein